MIKAFNIFLMIVTIGAAAVAVTSLNQLNQAIAIERARVMR